jgi:hypothetical protein
VIRLLWIPVAGTVAAVVAIVLAHEPRGDEGARPMDPLPFEFPPEPMEPPEEPEPPPPPSELHLRLEADGSLVDTETSERFASLAELREALGEVRPMLWIGNGEGVAEAQVDEALAQLSDRFQVRKVYRAPETPPGEGR